MTNSKQKENKVTFGGNPENFDDDTTCVYNKEKELFEEFEKMIDKFKDLRLYRSKSCQLLLKRLKQQIQELKEMKEK